MRMDNNIFINGIMSKINEIVTQNQLEKIYAELVSYTDNFDISEKNYQVSTLEELPREYKDFLVSKKLEGLSDNTIKTYKETLDRFFMDIHIPIKEITSITIKKFTAEYAFKKNMNTDKFPSAHTINNFQTVLNIFFQWCFDNGYIEKNPCSAISKTKYKKKDIDVLSDIEINKLFDYIGTIKNELNRETQRTIIMLFIDTGLRVSELACLKLSDIQWDKCSSGYIPSLVRNGKGSKERIVYISPACSEQLKKYLSLRKGNSEYFFVSAYGEHNNMSVRNIQKMMQRLGNNVGISGLHPHQLRHTTGTGMAENGIPTQVIQKILGHSSPETTIDYYVKTDQKEIIKQLSKVA